MAISLNYFLVGEYGGINPQTGKLDLGGIIDVIPSPIFPLVIENLVALVSFSGVESDTLFELRLNDPEDEIMAKIELGIRGQYPGLQAKQVMGIQNVVIQKRGRYTVDILEKNPTGYKFVKSVELFTAMYPPKRRFGEGEVEAILSRKEELIVSVKTDYTIPTSGEVIKYQLNLDETMPIEEGYEAFPKDDKLVGDDGTVYELEGVRRNIEWMFGQERPKEDATVSQESSEIQK